MATSKNNNSWTRWMLGILFVIAMSLVGYLQAESTKTIDTLRTRQARIVEDVTRCQILDSLIVNDLREIKEIVKDMNRQMDTLERKIDGGG